MVCADAVVQVISLLLVPRVDLVLFFGFVEEGKVELVLIVGDNEGVIVNLGVQGRFIVDLIVGRVE